MDFIYVTERNFPSSTWFRIKCHSVYEKKFSANQALTNTSVYEESHANNTIVNSRHNFDSNANAIAKFSPAKNKFNVFSLLQESDFDNRSFNFTQRLLQAHLYSVWVG